MTDPLNQPMPLILFIDDSPVDRALIQKMLPKHGFEVIVAENGEKGIATAIEKRPHLILLDVILPRMSGVEVCKKLKADPITKGIPVVFFSSIDLPQEFLNFSEVGGVDFISKMLKSDVIALRLNRAINNK